MALLSETLQEFFATHGFDRTYWLAYSGGLDSHVLLHLLTKLRAELPLNLRAVYINHGINLKSTAWAEHCARVCRALDVDFSFYELPPFEKNHLSPEDWLRQNRYAVFANLLQPDDMLLTAHHQNDQAETVLLQLLRGAGLKGLAAMPQIKPFAEGWHGRPLLNVTRAALQQYAEENQLQWVEDDSNQNVEFARNFLRHEILPSLLKNWPAATETLARSAAHCAETQSLLDIFVRQDLAAVRGTQAQTLSLQKLLLLEPVRQRYVLRAWLAELNLPMPSTVKLQQLFATVLHARQDKTPHHRWQNVELRRYRDDLFAEYVQTTHDDSQILSWDVVAPLSIQNIGMLHAVKTAGQGMRVDADNISVRFRKGGEVIRLQGRHCHHELKNLFQTWGVPPWLRARVPLIYSGETLAAVVGFGVASEFGVEAHEAGLSFVLESV